MCSRPLSTLVALQWACCSLLMPVLSQRVPRCCLTSGHVSRARWICWVCYCYAVSYICMYVDHTKNIWMTRSVKWYCRKKCLFLSWSLTSILVFCWVFYYRFCFFCMDQPTVVHLWLKSILVCALRRLMLLKVKEMAVFLSIAICSVWSSTSLSNGSFISGASLAQTYLLWTAPILDAVKALILIAKVYF